MSNAKPSHLSGPADEKVLILENTQLTSALNSLAIVNKELAYQNAEKEKRAAELVIANTELAYQNAEKEKRAAELVIANKELAYQNAEKEKRAAELIIANAHLHGALMNTVRVAMILSELRDPYTAGHERRVAEISVAISAELGFDMRRQEGIRVAGYLHDVGKMIIPAEILSKPGKLTAIEYTLIKQHAQAGHDVLKGVDFPWPIAEVALQHHERMDGTGYPQGLSGEDIILEARILAVADTVEAMSSHRPYRAALGLDKALAEIERGSGTAFDTAVAEVCLKLFREQGFKIPE
jgi:putative nucleotidyltransferase with HDIG domain